MSQLIDKIRDNIETVLGVTVIVVIGLSLLFYSRGKQAASCPSGQSCRAACPRTSCPTPVCPTGTTGTTGTNQPSVPPEFKPARLVTLRFRNGNGFDGFVTDENYFSFVLTYDNSNNKIITWPDQIWSFAFKQGVSAGDLTSSDSSNALRDFLTQDVDAVIDYNSCGRNFNLNPTSENDGKRVRIQFQKQSGRVRFYRNTSAGDNLAVNLCGGNPQHNGPYKGTVTMSGAFSRV